MKSKISKKLLSLSLAAAMMLTLLPANVVSAAPADSVETEQEAAAVKTSALANAEPAEPGLACLSSPARSRRTGRTT